MKRVQADETGHKHCTGQYFDYWQCVDKCVSLLLFYLNNKFDQCLSLFNIWGWFECRLHLGYLQNSSNGDNTYWGHIYECLFVCKKTHFWVKLVPWVETWIRSVLIAMNLASCCLFVETLKIEIDLCNKQDLAFTSFCVCGFRSSLT